MGILIDADIPINWERGLLDVEAHTQNREEEFYLSVVTVSEMLAMRYAARRGGTGIVSIILRRERK